MPLHFNPVNVRIGIVGLGHGGLPLAVESVRKYPVPGFDTKPPAWKNSAAAKTLPLRATCCLTVTYTLP